MTVYRRFAVGRYEYGGSGILDTVGSLLARNATKATAAAKRAVPDVIAHKLATTIAEGQIT